MHRESHRIAIREANRESNRIENLRIEISIPRSHHFFEMIIIPFQSRSSEFSSYSPWHLALYVALCLTKFGIKRSDRRRRRQRRTLPSRSANRSVLFADLLTLFFVNKDLSVEQIPQTVRFGYDNDINIHFIKNDQISLICEAFLCKNNENL